MHYHHVHYQPTHSTITASCIYICHNPRPPSTAARLVMHWCIISLIRQQYLVDDVDDAVVSYHTHGGHLGSVGLATVDVHLSMHSITQSGLFDLRSMSDHHCITDR